MSATDQYPKCTRLLVTAIYADGTSVMHDIPQPEDVEAGFVDVEPRFGDIGGPYSRPRPSSIRVTTAFRLSATLSLDGSRTSVVPVPAAPA